MPTTKKHQEAIVEILLDLAPTPEAKEIIRRHYTVVQTTYGTGNSARILQALTASLYDGLKYGNWPWIKF